MDKLKNAYYLLVLATVSLYLVVAVLGVAGYVTNKNRAHEGQESHAAICALRDNIKDRINDEEVFLAEHPKGIPGIPGKTIETTIKNQKNTLRALSGLDCS